MLRMSLRKISNKCSECLANVTNACECLRMGLQTLRMHLRMLRMSYQRCQCLAIFLRMLRIFDDAAAIGINSGANLPLAHCSFDFGKKPSNTTFHQEFQDFHYFTIMPTLGRPKRVRGGGRDRGRGSRPPETDSEMMKFN